MMGRFRRGRHTAARPPRKRRRWLRRLLKLATVALFALIIGPTVFIATQCYADGPAAPPPSGPLGAIPNAAREESFTFLTLPEWLIVYSTEEYGRFIEANAPSQFPYVGSIGQYWSAYGSVCAVTRGRYPFQTAYHVMLGVIGASFTAENLIKGAYENTVGRFTEWVSSRATPEDAWAARTAREYGAFMHTVPWYEFPFAARLASLWSETPMWGPHLLRKWERRLALTAEYSVKAVYGAVIGAASQGAYGAEAKQVHAHVTQTPASVFDDPTIVQVQKLDDQSYVVLMPRYEAFTKAALDLDGKGVRFVSIAGNDELLITALTPKGVSPSPGSAVIADLPILTDASKTRLALRVPLQALAAVMASLRSQGATIEHLYDF